MDELLAAGLVVWFVLDCITTHQIIKRGGRELNKRLARLMGIIGVDEALAITKCAVIVAVWFAQQAGWFAGPWVWVLVGMHVFYAGLITWNSYQLYKASRT